MMWTGSETRIDIVGVGDDEHAVGRTNREEATNKRARHGQVLVVVRVHEHLADGGSNPIPQKGSPNPSVISPTSSALRAAPHDCPALAGPALPHQAISPGLLPPSGSARSALLGLLNSYRHNVLLVPPAPSPSRKYASVQQPAARTLVQVNILAPAAPSQQPPQSKQPPAVLCTLIVHHRSTTSPTSAGLFVPLFFPMPPVCHHPGLLLRISPRHSSCPNRPQLFMVDVIPSCMLNFVNLLLPLPPGF